MIYLPIFPCFQIFVLKLGHHTITHKHWLPGVCTLLKNTGNHSM